MKKGWLLGLFIWSCANEDQNPPEQKIVTTYMQPQSSLDKIFQSPSYFWGSYDLKFLEGPRGTNPEVSLGFPFFQLTDSVVLKSVLGEDWSFEKRHLPQQLHFRSTEKGLLPLDDRTRFFFGVLSALDQFIHAFQDRLPAFLTSGDPVLTALFPHELIHENKGLLKSFRTRLIPKNNAAFLVEKNMILLFPSSQLFLGGGLTPGQNALVMAHEAGHFMYSVRFTEEQNQLIEERSRIYIEFAYLSRVLHELFADMTSFIVSGSTDILPGYPQRNPFLDSRSLSHIIRAYQAEGEGSMCSPYCLASLLFRVFLKHHLELYPQFANSHADRMVFFDRISHLATLLMTDLLSLTDYVDVSQLDSSAVQLNKFGFFFNVLPRLGRMLTLIAQIFEQKESLGSKSIFCEKAQAVFDVPEQLGSFMQACPSP